MKDCLIKIRYLSETSFRVPIVTITIW